MGQCLNVGRNIFDHHFNSLITDLKGQTKAWIAKALPIMEGVETS